MTFEIGQKLTGEQSEYANAAEWCNNNNARIDIIDDGYVIVDIPPPPPPTYSELRFAAYPTIQEQLDMQYWDEVNGTTVWKDTIQEIKDRYPKEAE